MNIHNFSIGDKKVLQASFTEEDVRVFSEITGDTNKIHLDESFASKSIFKSRIVHGFLVTSLFSRMFGTVFPGEGTIYLSQSFKFLKPVYLNDEVVCEVVITKINVERRIIEFKTECLVKDKVVVAGIAEVMV